MDNSQHRNLMMLRDWKELQYFKKEEFACPDGCGIIMNRDFVFRLDSLRERLGSALTVTSGYRCAEYNKKIGGSPNSKHIQGLAVDLKVNSSTHRYKILKEAFQMNFSGVGHGSTFIHLDDRTNGTVSWTY